MYEALKAEEEGFEPPVPRGTTVFKTAAFDHSAISPESRSCIPIAGDRVMSILRFRNPQLSWTPGRKLGFHRSRLRWLPFSFPSPETNPDPSSQRPSRLSQSPVGHSFKRRKPLAMLGASFAFGNHPENNYYIPIYQYY